MRRASRDFYFSGQRASHVQIGTALGIAANCFGWLIFFTTCGGFSAATSLSPLPILFGLIGLGFTIVGAIRRPSIVPQSHITAAIFINLFGILAGVLELSVWRHWMIFQS